MKAEQSVPIGIVGLGRMGANMARRLVECGWSVVALYDVRAEAAQELANELASSAVSQLAEVTQRAEIVLTVVTDDAAMHAIYAESGDSLWRGAEGKLFINCATVSPALHVQLAQTAQRLGASTLEACMASSITQARAGTLYLMCGGLPEDYQRVLPLLQSLSQQPRYLGLHGQAAQVKALVNLVMNINTAGLAEGLGLGAALGLDLQVLREVFAETGANSRVLQTDGEDMIQRDHTCYFSAAHAAKDTGIALQLARAKQLPLPLAEATLRQYEHLIALGLGELDKSAVAELTFLGRSGSLVQPHP